MRMDTTAVHRGKTGRVMMLLSGGAVGIAGKRFVMTGTLPSLKRWEAERLIAQAGGVACASVSRTIDFVVAGADAGSKLAKARALGLAVIDEPALLRMIAG